jgi:hypothetical protein
MVNLYQAFRNVCLQQRRVDTRMSPENFRKTLVQMLAESTDGELENLAIDVEDSET